VCLSPYLAFGSLAGCCSCFYRGKQGLSLANQFGCCLPSQRVADLSWSFVSLNSLPSLRIANKETQQLHRRRIVVWWKGAPSPIWSPCRAVSAVQSARLPKD
jgi:hypothetical protein